MPVPFHLPIRQADFLPQETYTTRVQAVNSLGAGQGRQRQQGQGSNAQHGEMRAVKTK